MLALLALSLLLQQPSVQLPAARVPTGDGLTSPPSGDTAGYWQQRVHYRISATLDERAQLLHATATLAYVNESPDTLREMYVHQYLNAFRPGSRWSADDAREGRVRFQTLKDPDYAHERFTAPVTVDGTPVRVEYPGAPDSTVARFDLPRPLLPGDSVVVAFAWDARLSTLPRRQGRRGRHWDFAQWYPKVAVYDRGGWEANPLRPAGEFYGEFGSYDVSLTVAADQVMGATGVPVAGDPGWERARRGGEVHLMRDAYGDAGVVPQSDGASATKTVRWLARDVHHFAWTTSPDYRYEGALYDGRVGIHVLYRPGDEREWGNGEAVRRTERALAWLESIYGRYPYPQVTNVHRIEGGGTEFPMMVMDGSASQGLILHEVGHIYSYGILANNEWRSGWMDEGLTSYQTSWAQGATPQELARGVVPIGDGDASAMLRPVPRQGYAARALRPDAGDLGDISQFRLDFLGRAEPVGTTAHEFGEFVIYNLMIYSRAEMMYGQLRDAVGDTAFRAFLRGYYDRWKLKHVDERAMRRSAEEASGDSLGWFFRQWVHGTGLIDYALRDVKTRREGDEWVTRARVVRRGEYRHPMPVGARAGGAWTIARADASRDDQWVELRTAAEPEEVRLDPLRTTTDWDRRNDVRPSLLDFRRVRYTFDWPFLDQSLRDRQVEALGPIGWYSTPGGAAVGVRTRSNYMGIVDRGEAGIVVSVRGPEGVDDDGLAGALGGRVGVWTVVEDPRIGRRPIMGLRLGAWALDGVGKLEVRKRWDASRFLFARAPRITHSLALTATFPRGDAWVDSRRWQPERDVVDAKWEGTYVSPRAGAPTLRVMALAGGAFGDDAAESPSLTRRGAFARGELETKLSRRVGNGNRGIVSARLFAGAQTDRTPLQRSLGLVSRDATDAFGNHLLRPKGAPLAREDVHYVDFGGGGLRGFSPLIRPRALAAANVEGGIALVRPKPNARRPELQLLAFADGGWLGGSWGGDANLLADAGIGLALRGPFFDRDIRVRVDLPFFVSEPDLSLGTASQRGGDRVKVRWAFSFADLW